MATFSARTSGRRSVIAWSAPRKRAAAGKRPTHARPNLPTCLGHAVPVNGLADRRRHSRSCFRKNHTLALHRGLSVPGQRCTVHRCTQCWVTVGGAIPYNNNNSQGEPARRRGQIGDRPGRHESREISNKPNLLNYYVIHTVLFIFQRTQKKKNV